MYWIGPLIGSVVAVLLYEYVIAGDAGVNKLKAGIYCDPSYNMKPTISTAISIKSSKYDHKRIRRPSMMAHFEDEHYAEMKRDAYYTPGTEHEVKQERVHVITEIGSVHFTEDG